MSFDVKMIADSQGEFGDRISSMLITFPRYILAELNTHRILSKNSASSRAIKFNTMCDSVLNNPFIPDAWMMDHTGMQGTQYFTDTKDIGELRKLWMQAVVEAVTKARELNRKGLTKQLCNRLLEAYAWHKVLVTGTEWENFTALRVDPAADIHMQKIAGMMLECLNNSTPKQLRGGEWHIPFGDIFDLKALEDSSFHDHSVDDWDEATQTRYKLMVATAKCAQTSYTVVGEDQKELNYEKLVALHDRLAKMGHWSPFEHCARAMNKEEHYLWYRGKLEWSKHPRIIDTTLVPNINDSGWCGNFRGFIQYRKLFENENRRDNRLLKK